VDCSAIEEEKEKGGGFVNTSFCLMSWTPGTFTLSGLQTRCYHESKYYFRQRFL